MARRIALALVLLVAGAGIGAGAYALWARERALPSADPHLAVVCDPHSPDKCWQKGHRVRGVRDQRSSCLADQVASSWTPASVAVNAPGTPPAGSPLNYVFVCLIPD